MSTTKKITVAAVRKAIAAALGAGLFTFAAGLAEGYDWRVALGMAAAAAVLAGGGTYAVPNKPTGSELRAQLDRAMADGRLGAGELRRHLERTV
jgi:sugar/nucleoside kinase (ribokinase family)